MEHSESPKTHESFEQFSHGAEVLAIHGLRNFINKAGEQKDAQTEKSEKQEVDNFIRHNKESLAAFSGDKTLRFTPSLVAETMAFYHKEGKIELPTKWFDGEYSDDELLFGCGHEISHFRDMRKNPEAYFDNFDYMESKGKELAKDYYKKHPEQGSEESMARFFAGELHTLYNCLDDIYVNKLTMDKAPAFYGGKKDAISGLYEKVGFKEPDLTDQPMHRQMVFSLLRDEMVGNEFGESIVDERVREVLDKKKMGKTTRNLVDTELKPIAGILVDPGKRYITIKQFIENKYLSLLELALEENNQEDERQKQTDEEGGEQPNPDNNTEYGQESEQIQDENAEQPERADQGDEQTESDEFNPFGDKKDQSKTILNERTIEEEREILKDIEEQNKIDEMSPEEKAKHIKKQQQEKFDREHGITSGERKEFDKTVNKIKPEREKMKKFWDKLIGKSISYERRLVQEQRKGKLNIDSLIKQYPDFIEAQNNGKLDELTIYDRNQMERVVINKPEEIEITLLVDGSGSMDGESMSIAREAATLLMLSIKDFNNKLEASRKETHSKLVAKTEVMMFGSDYETIKDFEKTTRFDAANEVEIIKSVGRMQAEYGNTNDASPLYDIANRITPEQKTKIDKDKLLKIVFEVTDGFPDDEEETKKAVEQLRSDGALAFAFQIGEQNDIFEEIWNSSNSPTGIFIGNNVKSLPDNLMQVLANVMKGVRI